MMDQQPLEQITTRSKAQKINNTNKETIKPVKKIRQSQKKERLNNSKNDLDIKESPKRESPKAKRSKSIKNTRSHRKHKLATKMETTDKFTAHDLDESANVLGIETESESNTNKRIKELGKHSSSPVNNSQNSKQSKTPNKKLKWKIVLTGANISPSMVTPKSTPPKLSLTPHRSKKTPKKSPVSLGSPKTHKKAVPRLFKSPRKLSLFSSPTYGLEDKCNNKSHKKSLSKKIKADGLSDKSVASDKDLCISPMEESKHSSSGTTLKSIHRFSKKQPKIALKTPKLKKSKSPSKLRLSIATPNATPELNTKSPSTFSPTNKNLSLIKRRVLKSKVMKLMTAAQIRDVLAEPVVLMEKLSPENIARMSTMSRTRSNSSMKVNSPLISRGNISKISTPAITKSPIEPSMFVVRNSSSKGKINKTSPRIKKNTLIQEKYRSSTPLMSSTPREENTPLMNINLTSDTPFISLVEASLNARTSRLNTRLSDARDGSTNIANESKPSLFDKSIDSTSRSYFSNDTIRQATCNESATMVLQEQQQSKKDGTYELEQPQTLSLQRMIKKRSSTDANLTPKADNKKAKVRFANVTADANSDRKLMGWTVSLPNISRSDGQRNSILNSGYKLKQIETLKFYGNLDSVTKRKSSPSNSKTTLTTSQLNMIQSTPTIFGSVSKKSEKKSSVKKKPNFAKIHERMFARSESLVDARKRLENRHIAFTVNKAVPKTNVKKKEKILPTDTNDGTHNRFGFKLRKTEATNVVLKKQPALSKQKQQQEARLMLKGVRTNRRFELQMKSRNIK